MRLRRAQRGTNGAADLVHECLHPSRPARAAVLVAVVVTGSLLISPLRPALVATVASWLVALGALSAAGTAPPLTHPHHADLEASWPTTLRAILTGLLLTLGALGVIRALLLGSWEALLASVVLVAAVTPWWLARIEPTSAAQERRHSTRDDAQVRLWQSRRRVDAAAFAATVGLSTALIALALTVVISEVVAGGPAQLSAAPTCHVSSVAIAPVLATVSALAAAAATAATALSARVRPAPGADLRRLATWCAVGAAAGLTASAALSLWWVC